MELCLGSTLDKPRGIVHWASSDLKVTLYNCQREEKIEALWLRFVRTPLPHPHLSNNFKKVLTLGL